MVMKTVIESLDDVAEGLREHYVENTNPTTKKTEFVLAIEGVIDPLPGVKALKQEAGSYRTKLTDIEGRYGKIKAFEGMNAEEVRAKLDRITELEAAAGGKLDDKAIDNIVETRIKTRTGPLERMIQSLTQERDGYKSQVDTYTAKEKTRMVSDEVRQAAVKLKMEPTAVEDAILLAERVMEVGEDGAVTVKDKVGYTPGVDVVTWLGDMQAKRPHWWGPSAGGGAGGNRGGGAADGINPWAHDTWNVTQQNKITISDSKKAERMAASAGTTVGGLKPAKRK
jgi:hypothetical protein